MILVKPSHEILSIMGSENKALYLIELAGRTCYKSESEFTDKTAIKFSKNILKRGHESVIEHSAMTVKFICDRGVTHELVRHRLAAYSQESTRYCNYKGGVTFVIPPWCFDFKTDVEYDRPINAKSIKSASLYWFESMIYAERQYIRLIDFFGWSPQQARSVLPNSLKTEIVMTANFREWRHVFTLRCSKAAHPQMRELMIPLLEECKKLIPVIFDDINLN